MQQTADYNPYAAPHGDVQQVIETADDIDIFSAQGRLGRLRFIAYTFAMSLVLFGVVGLLTLIFGGIGYAMTGAVKSLYIAGGIFLVIAIFPALFFSVRWGIRRVHDFNASGWLVILMFVPYVNSIFQILMVLVPGTKEANPYGPVPPPNSSGVKILVGCYIGIIVLVFVGAIAAAIMIPALSKL